MGRIGGMADPPEFTTPEADPETPSHDSESAALVQESAKPPVPDPEGEGNPHLLAYSDKQKERQKADREASILDNAQAIDIANREADDRKTAETKRIEPAI